MLNDLCGSAVQDAHINRALGPHAEDAAVRLTLACATAAGRFGGGPAGQSLPYRASRQKADLWIGDPRMGDRGEDGALHPDDLTRPHKLRPRCEEIPLRCVASRLPLIRLLEEDGEDSSNSACPSSMGVTRGHEQAATVLDAHWGMRPSCRSIVQIPLRPSARLMIVDFAWRVHSALLEWAHNIDQKAAVLLAFLAAAGVVAAKEILQKGGNLYSTEDRTLLGAGSTVWP